MAMTQEQKDVLTGKLEAFATLVQAEQLERLNRTMPKNPDEYPDFWLSSSATQVIKGRKYTKVNIGRSGKYMVVNDTGEIFGIKAYGVIHKGHRFGTLDTIADYYWGDYRAYKKTA